MIFNKNGNGTQELRKHISFLYSSLDYENIATDVELAVEDMIKTIGTEVYNVANAYYNSSTFNPEGTAVLDQFVNHLQLPVALFAVHEYAKTSDVSHESSGRKILIDEKSEKIPFEWMLDRDSAAILSKAHKTTDRLITFLESNPTATGWGNSDAQKLARSLFINTAKQFGEYYPIDDSRRFFIKILPFMKKIERRHLQPILGIRFEELKTKITAGNLSDDDKLLLSYICDALTYNTILDAVKKFTLEIIPEGVFQPYISEKLTTRGKLPPSAEIRREVITILELEVDRSFRNLQEYLTKLDNPDTYNDEPFDLFPKNEVENKHFRV